MAKADDDPTLKMFKCSGGPWFETEVERVVQEAVGKYVGVSNARVLLFFVEDDLVAVACHHPVPWSAPPTGFAAPTDWQAGALGTEVLVVAVAVEFQGSRIGDREGERLSDYVLRSTLSDALDQRWTGPASAMISVFNSRSLALFRRLGFFVAGQIAGPSPYLAVDTTYFQLIAFLPAADTTS